MPINRIDGPNSVPTAVADYQAQNNLIGIAYRQNVAPFSGANMNDGAIFDIGGTIYRVNGVTAISGSQSDYVKITHSGATASASFVADWTGVTWNEIYNGFYDVDGNLYFCAYHFGERIFEKFGPYTGDFIPPPYSSYASLVLIGSGGNGSAGQGTNVGGAGGGSGAYYIGKVNLTPQNTYQIVLSNTSSTTAFGFTCGRGGNASGATPGLGGTGSGGALDGGRGNIATGGIGGGGGGILAQGIFLQNLSTGYGNGSYNPATTTCPGGSYKDLGMGGNHGTKSPDLVPPGRGGIGGGGGGGANVSTAPSTTAQGGATSLGGGGGGGGGGRPIDLGSNGSGGTGGPAYIRITW